jgi:uncharacterized membrane protein HdeD (DUF308 family)
MFDMIRAHRTYFIVEGIILLILGALAIALPVFFSFAFELIIGWLFVISGIIQCYRIYKMWKYPGIGSAIFLALLTLAVGIILLVYPLTGVLSLVLLMTFFFFLEGISKLVFAYQHRAVPGWVWILVSALISIALGALILAGWPETGLWALGLLVGINMAFLGISLISLAFSVPKIHEE